MAEESAEKKVGDAVDDVAAAERAKAEAVKKAAEAESTESIAQASIDATAAAQAAAALAETNAAKTIADNEDKLQWLRNHAQQTESSFLSLQEQQTQLSNSLPGLFQAQRETLLSELKTHLTPPPSISNATTNVNPPEQSEGEDARREAALKKEKKKPTKRWT